MVAGAVAPPGGRFGGLGVLGVDGVGAGGGRWGCSRLLQSPENLPELVIGQDDKYGTDLAWKKNHH